MAPRRNAMGFNGMGHFADLFGPSTTTAMEQLFHQQHQQHQQQQPYQQLVQQQHYEECCVPTGDCFMRSAPIRPEDPRAAELYARVVCSDGGCPAGRYMHRECFDAWERLVLVYMKNAAATYANGNATPQPNGRRIKDLWTVNVNNNNVVNLNKKGYEMAFKACGCRCGRGYLKKDSEWPQQTSLAPAGVRRRSSGGSGGRATTCWTAWSGRRPHRRPSRQEEEAPPARRGQTTRGRGVRDDDGRRLRRAPAPRRQPVRFLERFQFARHQFRQQRVARPLGIVRFQQQHRRRFRFRVVVVQEARGGLFERRFREVNRNLFSIYTLGVGDSGVVWCLMSSSISYSRSFPVRSAVEDSWC
ncbi:hypothetical protein AGLY_007888 [Aphis glycines]|uniref:Headcase N-terminal domain-containing protein n=1 Tax=Aphis glycines TaxID=307491 RepID=A0A6G0TNV5_APHGL|nr:hypothetical protein AGLY_007888 [Aphis glycines]